MTEHTVEFVGTGERLRVAETETVLSRCIEAGIAQEYSCRVGMCLACSARIVEGAVTQPAARGLTDDEREAYALTCMARPQTDLVLERGRYPPSIEGEVTPDDSAGADEPARADD